MATTRLQPDGVPGKPVSFSTKTPKFGPHTGTFTWLSANGTSGPRYSFAAKSPRFGPHTGEFTWLWAIGTPGPRYTFVSEAPPSAGAPAWIYRPPTYADFNKPPTKDYRDEEELLMLALLEADEDYT